MPYQSIMRFFALVENLEKVENLEWYRHMDLLLIVFNYDVATYSPENSIAYNSILLQNT